MFTTMAVSRSSSSPTVRSTEGASSSSSTKISEAVQAPVKAAACEEFTLVHDSLQGAVVARPGLPRTGHRRRLPKDEINRVYGNDQSPPWMTMKDYTSIQLVQKLAPQTAFSSSTTLPTYYGLSFLASSLDNFASLANVFDQYRIDEIEVQIVPSVTEVTISTSDVGQYYSAVDVDDATAPTSLAQVGGYTSCVVSGGNTTHFHRWRPQYAVAAYSGVFTSFGAMKGWIDCSSPNVQHYGLKIACTPTSATQTYTLLISYKISFQSLH